MTPLVSILMPTYNHARFITQAVESAMMQETEFPFELVISDDCSTDGTLALARALQARFPCRIRLFAQAQNGGLLKNYKFLLEHATGKYLAILESDDVWTDARKLQKQVSYLEAHTECALVCSDYTTINEGGAHTGNVVKDFDSGLGGDWYGALMAFSSIGALTLVFRRTAFDAWCNIDDYIERRFQTFDRPTWLCIAANAKCHFLHEMLAAYRVMSSSISNSGAFEKALSFADSIMDIHEYAIEKYGLRGISRAAFDDMKEIWYINLCVMHRKFHEFREHARRLSGATTQHKIMRSFPALWWLQYTLRHPKPPHLK